MRVATIGLDVARNVVQVHGADAAGAAVVRRRRRRAEALAFFAGLERCLVGMEARRGAHHRARELATLGHGVRLMPPRHARPYVKRNRNDAADAEAVCAAVTRPIPRSDVSEADRALRCGEEHRPAIGADAAHERACQGAGPADPPSARWSARTWAIRRRSGPGWKARQGW